MLNATVAVAFALVAGGVLGVIVAMNRAFPASRADPEASSTATDSWIDHW